MAYIELHCETCNGSWQVYERDVQRDSSRTCPHCFSEVDTQTWDRQIVPAFGAVDDANRELFKDATGYHRPLFTFDVISNGLYRNRDAGGCPLKDVLTDMIE